MRANRDGKAVVPDNGGYDIEVVEVVGGPDWMMAMPPAKSRGRLIPMGDGEGLPERPSPVRKKQSQTPLVPTRDEIESLPRWARVALASRCARRVLPTIKFFWNRLPEHHVQSVAEAISVAETAAATAYLNAAHAVSFPFAVVFATDPAFTDVTSAALPPGTPRASSSSARPLTAP